MLESYYKKRELDDMGFIDVGENVKISHNTGIYFPENISLGSNIRIDDFCTLTGKIRIGNYVHISSHCALYGAGGINFCDFSGLSGRVSIYSVTNDYSGDFLTNPTVPEIYSRNIFGPVNLEKHSIVGSGSIILPDVTLKEGCAIGALSLVKDDMPAWKICLGNPARPILNRSKRILELEKEFMDNINNTV